VKQDAPTRRVIFQGVDHAGDLVEFTTVRPLPAAPLLTVFVMAFIYGSLHYMPFRPTICPPYIVINA
jgi:hypothetical protein